MEKIVIKNVDDFGEQDGGKTLVVRVPSYADVSDGYHTIEELYDHRITLYIALCQNIQCHDFVEMCDGKEITEARVWRSKLHHDGTGFDGWYILGIYREPGKQITYHIPMSRWEETNFADTFEKAPVPFDGHTSADVIERLKYL